MRLLAPLSCWLLMKEVGPVFRRQADKQFESDQLAGWLAGWVGGCYSALLGTHGPSGVPEWLDSGGMEQGRQQKRVGWVGGISRVW